jgi:hypothetical protein
VYSYAYTMVEGKAPADMPGVLAETFAKTVSEARADDLDWILAASGRAPADDGRLPLIG